MNALPPIPRWPATKILSDLLKGTVVSSQKLPDRQDALHRFRGKPVTGCLVLLRIAHPFSIPGNENHSMGRCDSARECRFGPTIAAAEEPSGPTDSLVVE